MAKPPSRGKKATSAVSIDSETPASSTENIFNQEDPAFATITVSAVEVPELTEEEQSDKPDGMATLTACT
ncbi:hypothetical protein [Nostoc sp.]|uniref:hypothetical protein n=1 Tax=Nostoc sp. TaxID=1180 RepID=UPI002FF968A7